MTEGSPVDHEHFIRSAYAGRRAGAPVSSLFSASPFFNALCSQGRRYITSQQRTSNNIPTSFSCLHHSTAPGPSARLRRAGAGAGCTAGAAGVGCAAVVHGVFSSKGFGGPGPFARELDWRLGTGGTPPECDEGTDPPPASTERRTRDAPHHPRRRPPEQTNAETDSRRPPPRWNGPRPVSLGR